MCIFCDIANKQMAAEKMPNLIYEDSFCVAFNDINPRADVHILLVPKIHLENFNELTEAHVELMGNMCVAVEKIAKKLKLVEPGYRLLVNNGKGCGQEIMHLHFHILSNNN